MDDLLGILRRWEAMNPVSSEPVPHLKRVLGLWDLVFYGIVLIQPITAVGLLGVARFPEVMGTGS